MFSLRAAHRNAPAATTAEDLPTRPVVVDHNGRTDVAATLYQCGTPVEREVTAKFLLSAGRAMIDDVKALKALGYSGVVLNTIRAEGEALVIRALWMAPTGVGIRIGADWFRLQGLDPEGVVRYGRRGPDGDPVNLINIGEVTATEVEELAL